MISVTLIFNQVVGTFSDSESPNDEVSGALSPQERRSGTQEEEEEEGAAVAAASSVAAMDAPSPLPRIDAGGAGVQAHMEASSMPGAEGSPGVESTREYSESDDDDDLDTPGGGMLMGERLIP